MANSPMLVCEVVDKTGGIELLFYGRRSIPGMVAGATVTATGRTLSHHGTLAIANPRYELNPDHGGDDKHAHHDRSARR